MAASAFDKYKRNRLAGRLAGRYIRFVKRSSSVVSEPTDPQALLRENHPSIMAMWHGQFMLLAPFAPAGMPVANMVARHGDAEVIGEALKTFGMELVRGGGAAGRRKDRGGVHAFREALRLLGEGTTIAMTADVPPGPARKAGIGIVKLAQRSGRPIIPIATASSRFRTFDTWSRLTINLPFSRIGVTRGEPIWVAADADAAALEAARLAVEDGLNQATARAYRLAGRNAAEVTPYSALSPTDAPARTSARLRIYQSATWLLTPVLPLILGYRERRGKEEPARRGERLGQASVERPAGELIWVHAASVGETNAILPMIDELRRLRPGSRYLLTTGTVTSAALARERLRPGDIHQYAPLDAPSCVTGFLDHWRPDLAALTESEIWPNMIVACHDRNIPMTLVNARMSDRSYRRWRRNKSLARPLFSRIRLILAQNERLARRFRELGGREVITAGNLKADAPALPVDDGILLELERRIGTRPVFVAASTHPGEDAIVLEAFAKLKPAHGNLLLVLIPRHPERGEDVARLSAENNFATVRRRAGGAIAPGTDVYVADTVGEMGIFYSLARIAFIGGSLVDRGGQNPLEAVRLSASVIVGPSNYNFRDVYDELRRRSGIVEISDADTLADAVERLLINEEAYQALLTNADQALASMSGAMARTAHALCALLPPEPDGDRPDEDLTRAA